MEIVLKNNMEAHNPLRHKLGRTGNLQYNEFEERSFGICPLGFCYRKAISPNGEKLKERIKQDYSTGEITTRNHICLKS